MHEQMNVIMYGDTSRSADMRHVVPVFMRDPFIYVERAGHRFAFVHDYDVPIVSALPNITVDSIESLGLAELMKSGCNPHAALREATLRACQRLNVANAVTPAEFPLDVGDYLRSRGITLAVDRGMFERRRRQKLEWQVEGIRRAQRAAEAAMEAVRHALRSRPGVSTDELRAEATRVLGESGMTYDVMIVSHGPQSAVIHHRGSGVVLAGESVLVDIFPRDPRSGCWADMTRTFSVGEPPKELCGYQSACLEARAAAIQMIRPGVTGARVHEIAVNVFQNRGYSVERSEASDGEHVARFVHGLGHGVGLELHEPPLLNVGGESLIAGDVVTVEPGLYRQHFGGYRVEDTVLVTEQGCEVLTDFDYDLKV